MNNFLFEINVPDGNCLLHNLTYPTPNLISAPNEKVGHLQSLVCRRGCISSENVGEMMRLAEGSFNLNN